MSVYRRLSAFLLVSCVGFGADFYVAPNGRDTWSGRLAQPDAGKTDGPLATLAAARDAARKLPANEARRIILKGGKYFLDSTVTLDARDSGLAVEAAPGEKPVLYGGRLITGWRKDGKDFWSAKLPEVAAGKWDFRMLVVNDEIAKRARLPESGTFTHLSEFKVRWMSTTGGGWQRKPTQEELTTLKYRPGDLGPWLEVKNAEVTVYHKWDESLVTLSQHDASAQTLRFATPAGHPAGGFGVQNYVVWNVREGLKQPGQWYLDRKAGKVVYWPAAGQAMKRTEVIAPTVESVLRIEGTQAAPVKGVTLQGLTVSVTNTPAGAGGFGAGRYEGAVTVNQCEDCRLRNLTIFNSGGQGIKSREAVRLAVEDSLVRHTGAGGVVVRGAKFTIAGNRIHNVGVVYPSAIALSCGGEDGLVSHNEIHDTPYSAVTASGTGHLIEGNRIYRAMQVLEDGAGIYITFCKRIRLRGNHISDIADKGGSGASAYYLDEQAEDCVVEKNIAVNLAYPSHNHMARRNIIRDNVFIAPGDARITLHRCADYTFERNVIYAAGELVFHSPQGGIARMAANVLFSGTGKVELANLADYTAAGRTPLEPRDGTVIADPLFLDLKKGDYRYAPNSPASILGIVPLDGKSAGPAAALPGAQSRTPTVAGPLSKLLVNTAKSIQSDFLGVNAIYHGFAFMPEEIERGMTDADRSREFDRVRRMRLKIARTWYRPDWACGSSISGDFDWESSKMKAFYRWLAAMKERGVEVALQGGWWFPRDTHLGLDSPDPARDLPRFTAWLSESLHQIIEVRGFRNVRYLILFTEPTQAVGRSLPPGETTWSYYVKTVNAIHDRLVADGRRNLVKLVGPNNGAEARNLKDAVADLNRVIDVYSGHSYKVPGYEGWLSLAQSMSSVVAPTGKPLWFDEYGASGGSSKEAYRASGDYGTCLAEIVAATMNAGHQPR